MTELGFQYVMKTCAKPMCSQGFTEEELKELKERSDDHSEKLKTGMKNHWGAANGDFVGCGQCW